MKKLSSNLILLILTITLSLFSFASCTVTSADGECLVVVGVEDNYKEYKINLEDVKITEGVLSLVKYLEENEGLDAKYTDGGYGAYFTEINGIVPDYTKGEYVAVFTSVEGDFDVSTSFKETEYRGIALGYSGFGVSSMKVEGGATYLITIDVFTYE